ncbi:SRPBCC family protein [Kribbella pittospori]|uniref:SRPBCC family protein n=1 Tax=Kribbella pittospori TaxID=722689 RepID=UPI00192D317A|nr:SRPBCC family protein [Kribbella pittospori]
MKLEHKFVVPAPVDEAWVAFNDLGRVVPCFPGATLTSAEGDEFTGSCKVKLGPVSLQYSGNGTFVERDESDHHAVIEAKGKDRRGNGTASVRVVARLTAADATSTQVTVDTDLTITGRPAQFGRGLIQEVSDRLLDQFTTCLTTTLQTTTTSTAPASAATPAPSTTPATPAASAPSTTPATPATSAPSTTPATSPASAPSTEPTAQAQPAGSAQPTDPAQPADAARAAGPDQPGDQPASMGQPGAPAAPATGAGASSATAPGGGPASAAGTASASDATEASASGATSASASGAGSEPVELNLVTTMLPVLARRVRPYLIGAVVALVLRRLLRR